MRVVAALLFAGALGVNGLANGLPLNDRTTGELAALYPNLFVPAGVTFSIWGVIYLALAVWAVVQFLPRWAGWGRTMAPYFAVASALNASWLFAWHWEQVGLSVLVMLGLLGVLVLANGRLLRGGPLPARIAFGLILGWICVATIANVTALLVAVGWGGLGLGDAPWAAIMTAVGAGVGGAAALHLRNPYLGWAVVWALSGIVLARWDDVSWIAWVAGAGALGVAGAAILAGLRPLPSRAPAPGG